jgi:hypothetical protein
MCNGVLSMQFDRPLGFEKRWPLSGFTSNEQPVGPLDGE